ncbi:MAG: alcohol dehydrogenase catalytic domain-containing protein [Gemmatimonadota bacterium]
MIAIWLEDGRLVVRHDVPPPEPPRGETLIRVLIAGICNTDLELVRGYYPYTGILGHEFVGVVERGPEALIGRRVVGEINVACGGCSECSAGRPRHCRSRTVLGIAGRPGAFAEYLALPDSNLHMVPSEVSMEAAVFTEPLAAALEIQEQVTVAPTDRVLVVGDGKLGLLVAQSLAATGCELLVIGRHRAKLELLAARGIRTGLDADAESASFDVAVECTGNAEGFEIARAALRPRGTLAMKSTYAGRLTVDASALVVDEITLIGSRCGPFEPALRLLREGGVDVMPLVHARYPLEEGVAAFEHAERPGVLKVLLEVGVEEAA